MPLKKYPELLNFLVAVFPDRDPETDVEAAADFVRTADSDLVAKIAGQLEALLVAGAIPTEEFGSEANRWFASEDEARDWVGRIGEAFAAGAGASEDGVIVKDSNGTPLAEGDSVTVIKDLKVKGGSSDLKRGTLIKKIHLIGDPANIECRVDGSTLVLKTIFLKKA
ncbi:MAG: alkylphosphonate utilization protein [Bdellovibrionales bacterium]|nr:alkylphosphonate utilization protein [Bdellovibrionales bacterium]